VQLEEAQGHTKWTEAEAIELKQINDYDTLRDLGKDLQKNTRKYRYTLFMIANMMDVSKHV
jgi:hypothetical protein